MLERKDEIELRDIAVEEALGPRDVRMALRTVGVCGSDVHYYTHGAIGPFVVKEPMILGHEAAGEVVEVGSAVTELKTGDRVCMEPGIPDPASRAARLGKYNLDPAVRFWATPPVHGILRPTVVHPADFTFKLPDHVTYAEGAMVEPLAVGMHAATKVQVQPGDIAVVIGAGPIGMVTVLAALAAGCSRVIVSDVHDPKLELAASSGRCCRSMSARRSSPTWSAARPTAGVPTWCSNARATRPAMAEMFDLLCPGGRVALVGIPLEPFAFDVSKAQVKEARIENVFRYAHVYPRAVALLASGKIDVKPLITDRYAFADSVEAFDFAKAMPPASVKVQIEMPA